MSVYVVGDNFERYRSYCASRGAPDGAHVGIHYVSRIEDVQGRRLTPDDEVIYLGGDPALVDALEARRATSSGQECSDG